jgi:RNA polymerase sigma factor (sigma-70 family)
MIQPAVRCVEGGMGFPRPSTARNEQAPLSPGVRRLSVVSLNPDRPATPPDPDWAAELARVAESQDRAAFGRLFQHFAPRLKSWLMRTGSSDEQAEELAQEAMVTVWRKAALFNPAQAAVSTWIFTIARNLRVDAARRRQLDGAGDESFEFDLLAAEQPGSDELLDASRLTARVRDALRQLPPEQAQVLRLSYYDDEPHARIAAELGIPLGTVKSRMRLAVQHLRRLLDL